MPAGPPLTGWRRPARALELGLVFVASPLVLVPFGAEVGPLLLPILLGLGGLAALVLACDPRYAARRLVSPAGLSGALPGILLRLALGGALVTALLLLSRPELFLSLPRARPRLFAIVLVLYPILSAWPQEILFRALFFQRYRALLGGLPATILASGVTFGLAHFFFGNWIAPGLSTLGGLLFARTYARTGSLAAATLEHALWGDLLITIGLGRFFYGGAIGG